MIIAATVGANLFGFFSSRLRTQNDALTSPTKKGIDKMSFVKNAMYGVGLVLTVEVVSTIANIGWSYVDGQKRTFSEFVLGETGLSAGGVA
jgi:hypothetical protein